MVLSMSRCEELDRQRCWSIGSVEGRRSRDNVTQTVAYKAMKSLKNFSDGL